MEVSLLQGRAEREGLRMSKLLGGREGKGKKGEGRKPRVSGLWPLGKPQASWGDRLW